MNGGIRTSISVSSIRVRRIGSWSPPRDKAVPPEASPPRAAPAPVRRQLSRPSHVDAFRLGTRPALARPRPDQFALTARTADAVHGIPPAAADGGDAAPDLGVQLSPLIAPAHADAVLIEVNSPGNQFG